MFDYLIFDFDGTLSDTYPIATQVLLDTLAKRGETAPYEEVYAALKNSYGYAIKKYDIPNDGSFSRNAAAEALRSQRPFAETAELLRRATERGKKIFIYTHSGPEVGQMLKKWGIAEYVTYILDNTHKFPRKPDPTALLFLLDKFSIEKDKALMIGDRDIDILVGHNAGIAGCLFDPGCYYADCETEFRVENLLEITKFY